ncbi:unnamed protein product [marine sediment metagenome]|uniref:Uncharacterized protein n=1 Tax=marine sediment metagenome TaxID=412755 RepID=X1W0H1_9ZZZZ
MPELGNSTNPMNTIDPTNRKITKAADFVRERIKREPLIGMITGTGLGNLTDTMETRHFLQSVFSRQWG